MSNNIIIRNNLVYILECIDLIEERFRNIKAADDFVLNPFGVTQLDSIAMRLQTIGETVKSIDKRDPGLLKKFTSVDWVEIIRMRDIISHHYRNVDHVVVYNTCKNDIPKLKTVIEVIIIEYNN